MVIHEAALAADHVQSRVVLTSIVPLAPVAGAELIEFEAETWHFGADGAVTDTELDPQAAAKNASSQSHGNGRARMAALHSASTLPRKADVLRI